MMDGEMASGGPTALIVGGGSQRWTGARHSIASISWVECCSST